MLRKLWLLMKWLIIILVILVVLAYLFLRFAPTFGGKPDAKTQEKFLRQSTLMVKFLKI